jgi:hypothetical protein
MSSENLATLSELGAFNETLALLASNLAAHVNDPLDKAHSLALLQGYVDSNGNDLRTYQDSVGNIYSNTDTSGYNFVRFVINGQPYYAPAKTTALDGKPTTTGALTSPDAASDEPSVTSLMPEFVTFEEQAAINTNTLFLEHTHKAAQSAHLNMSVVASTLTDSAGNTVARHRVRLQIDNFIWEVPADARLGGPPQPVVSTGAAPLTVVFSAPINGSFYLSGTTVYMHVRGGKSWPGGVTWTYSGVTGSRPIQYTWEYSTDGINYVTIPIAGFEGARGNGGYIPTSWTNDTSGNTQVTGTVPASGTVVAQFALDTPGGDDRDNWWMRIKLDNTAAGGSVVYGTPIYCSMKDKSSSWLCTVAYDKGFIPRHIYKADMLYTQRHVDDITKEGYALWAFPLSRLLYKHDWLLAILLPAIKAWTYHMAFLQGVYPLDNFTGTLIFGVVRRACWCLGHAARFFKIKTAVSQPQ